MFSYSYISLAIVLNPFNDLFEYELFTFAGDNHDVEGVDVKNACFGGTQAVFHAVDWIHANYSVDGM